MLKNLYFINIILLFFIVDIDIHAKNISLCKMSVPDSSTLLVLSDCVKKAPHIRRFSVYISHKGGQYISIIGYKGNEKFDYFETCENCGYTEIDNCIFLFFGDTECKDWIIDNSTYKYFEISDYPEVGGTPYSWTYLIKNGNIYYLGNLNSE